MQSLWAPWRVEYYDNKEQTPDFFLEAAQTSNDADHFVILRRKASFLMMNRFPYSAGHLMAVPYRKVARISALAKDEKVELLDLASYSEQLLERVIKAEGFNIGWNVGSAAGAGTADHLHLHIVPRWKGDHNFMTVLGDTRIIPEGLRPLYERLRKAAEEIGL